MKKITLFALPFAGGSRYSYAEFKNYLPEFIDLVSLELPGRGRRITEECLSGVREMTEDLLSAIRSETAGRYAFYGHSLGSLMAFLLTREIIREGLNPPVALILSGRSGPSEKRRLPMIHDLPKDEFLSSLREMGGMPDVLLENEELMEFFEPIIRADLKAAETYVYEPAPPFNVPVSVMIGADEGIADSEAKAWQKETSVPIRFSKFPGHHFFIMDHADTVINEISEFLHSINLETIS
ncbi:MAG TPA: alpha/beta fold hydrolase [Flavilitoribacter sp.]|nr:alpha/beta fold hydrolase [Flavilitoribacter sp.]